MNGVQEQKVYSLAIDGYAADGSGVARLEGRVVFVKGAIRGERCDVRLEKVGRSAAWGHVEQVVEPSPARRETDCPYDAHCGGCTFRHMDYAEELEAKRQKVEDALRRIGGVACPVSVIHGAKNTERYRNKVQFPVSSGPCIGFYQERTHHVTNVDDCLLQPHSAARLRAATLEWMKRHSVSAYEEKTGKGLVRHVYVRSNRAGETLFCLLVNGTSVPAEGALTQALRAVEPGLRGVVLGSNTTRSNVILGDSYRTLWGEPFLMDRMCGLSVGLSVPSFYQVNTDQAEVLYQRALAFAQLNGTETVLDLYCGIGTISLVLAREAGRVLGAEVISQAVEDARENARRNGMTNLDVLLADAGEAAQALAEKGERPDVVCVDPPRKGLSGRVISAIVSMSPRRVVYVSCDCATLARDIKEFTAQGYTLSRVEAVDLFPRTCHVECVALLQREGLTDRAAHLEVLR